MRFGLAVYALGICVVYPALAQQAAPDEPQRQLGAHAHGQGKLSIAFEKKSVEIELEAPANDIVGFEHAAKTPEQKATIAKARATLAKPVSVFKLPDAAACKLTSAKVKLVGGGAAHSHSHGAKSTEAAASHSEFHAEYTFACAKPELIQEIEFDYFKTFPGAQALDVSIVGIKGQQSQSKVSRDKPMLNLKSNI